MKILFFHRWVGVHYGGTERQINEIASFLGKQGHEVSILTREGPLVQELRESYTVYTVSRNPGESDFSYEDWRVYLHTFLYMWKTFFKLLSLRFKGRCFDIISVHFATESLVAQVFRFFTRTPFLFVLAGYTDLEAKLARSADLTVAISRHEIEECYKHYGYRPVLNSIGINLNDFARRGSQIGIRSSDPGRKVVLTVCRLEPRKDLVTLLDAVRILKNEGAKYLKFLIVGDGISQEGLNQYSRKLALTDVVEFAGRANQQDLARYYFSSDMFVLPTLYEGFGIVYLEAMAAGLPIISTRVGAVPEVVGDSGILIEPKNPALLAAKIKELSENEAMRRGFAEKGLRRVKEFDSAILLGKLENDIARLIGCRLG